MSDETQDETWEHILDFGDIDWGQAEDHTVLSIYYPANQYLLDLDRWVHEFFKRTAIPEIIPTPKDDNGETQKS